MSPLFFMRFCTKFYKKQAELVASNPRLTIFIGVLFTVLSSAIIPFSEIKDDFEIGYTPSDARALQEMESYRNFSHGHLITLMVYVTATDGGSLHRLAQLNATVDLIDVIGTKFKIKNSSFYEFCDSFCMANQPVAVFRDGLLIQTNIVHDFGSIDAHRVNLSFPIITYFGRPIDLSVNFHGIELLTDPSDHNVTLTNLKSAKLILLIYRAAKPSTWSDKDIVKWNQEIVQYCHDFYNSSLIVPRVISFPYIQTEIVRTATTLFPYLSVGFIIMCFCTLITIYVNSVFIGQWSWIKVVYALSACICPLMAAASTLGTLFWLGFRFGSVLLAVPFLILAIGVDDSFIMITAWDKLLARKTKSYIVENHIQLAVQLLEEVGPTITITSITNCLAFGIGALLSIPEIRLFCTANGLGMLFDLLYCITLYLAILTIGVKYTKTGENWTAIELTTIEKRRSNVTHYLMKYYALLLGRSGAIVVTLLLFLYWILSMIIIYGAKSNIDVKTLIIADSPLMKVLDLREKYVFPEYSFVIVFVNDLGDLLNESRVHRIKSLVGDFELLSECNGREFTHFWMREYERFRADVDRMDAIDETTTLFYSPESIQEFLNWQENRRWRGYIKFNSIEKERIDSFFFLVPYHGERLSQWSEKQRMLNLWRSIVDNYTDLSASVFEDNAQFTDQLEILFPLTIQSSIGTLTMMFIVCFVFMYNAAPVFVASFSTLSIFVGVFAGLILWNIDLNPLSVSVLMLTIGMSVEYSAHLCYNYYNDACASKPMSSLDRLIRSFSNIGYPLLQCSISSSLYLLCLLFVDCYMSELFIKAVVAVTIIGLIHAYVFIPLLLFISSEISSKRSLSSKGEEVHNNIIHQQINQKPKIHQLMK